MPIATLIHRHPMRSAAAAMLDAERALDEVQRQFALYPKLRAAGAQRAAPSIEALEDEKGYVIRAELPGLEPDLLNVFVEEGLLTIRGGKPVEAKKGEELVEQPGDEAESAVATVEPSLPLAREWPAFERRIRFNAEIEEDAVKAQYRNGLLTVFVPKHIEPKAEPRTIPVQVG